MELVKIENELVTQTLDVAVVFAPNGLENIITAIEDKARAHVPDVLTVKGRAAIGSLCQKVASSKVLLDNAGKKYVEDLKDKIKPVDAERKRMRDRLDALKEEINKPREEWEEQERIRLEAEETAREIEQAHGEALEMEALLAREREVARKEAEFARLEDERKAAIALQVYQEEQARLAKEQAEREERLKAEAAETARSEAEEKAARLIAEAKEREEQAERDRLKAVEDAKVAAEMAEARRIAAEEKAKADQEQAVKEAEARAAAETARKQAEKEKAERAAREAAEQKAADLNHRKQVDMLAVAALVKIEGITFSMAEDVVAQIAAGHIPGVTVNY